MLLLVYFIGVCLTFFFVISETGGVRLKEMYVAFVLGLLWPIVLLALMVLIAFSLIEVEVK